MGTPKKLRRLERPLSAKGVTMRDEDFSSLCGVYDAADKVDQWSGLLLDAHEDKTSSINALDVEALEWNIALLVYRARFLERSLAALHAYASLPELSGLHEVRTIVERADAVAWEAYRILDEAIA